MRRLSRAQYGLVLIAVIGVLGGISIAKGGLYVDRYEGDLVHMLDIVMRLTQGQIPHIDLSTPLGLAAFYPIVLFTKLGVGAGLSFIYAQILIAVLMLPIVMRTGLSRLTGLAAWLFGIATMVMILALVHGEAVASQSVSMYYNRWAWALTFCLVLLAVIPAHKNVKKPYIDGIIIGGLLAVLALLKPTYFIALAIPVTLALGLRGAWRSLVIAVLAGLAVALAVWAYFGTDFYMYYVTDLLSVTASETRAAPGAELSEILNGPRFLIGTLTLVLSVIVLRQGGQGRAGLALLVFAPAFVYVTYQNFGNDPKWLLLLCIYLMAHRPNAGLRVIFNADARHATAALALVSFALIAPSFQNMITSPTRHLGEDESGYQLLIKDVDIAQDLWVYTDRMAVMSEKRPLTDRLPALAAYGKPAPEPTQFMGENLPNCSLVSGDTVVQTYMADRLKEAPFGYGPETQFFIADTATLIWMAGGFAPLTRGAPWHYSGAPGIEHADVLVVPLCPIDARSQSDTLAAIEAAGVTIDPPIKNDLMWVYNIVK
ncbi:hypothetical protein EDD53_1485 [Pacificibacter maritimus]|uniref:Dolichyl-phosphate-mannose-protein mannosyltransferase n=1 Tax=Pacificibacter maritimus TaxID=762213 RepID=A0A3N4UID7_9RHOB|nr:hypothetical protein [Pacificibacter maritimus]RPE67081.1 hypothetical protein EDD53_1485 [Pacificibacter maritimus]